MLEHLCIGCLLFTVLFLSCLRNDIVILGTLIVLLAYLLTVLYVATMFVVK